jgi:exopolyphosphatase/guanosine-5'-triphosphate,3'-diphosphate pyrophosphatase
VTTVAAIDCGTNSIRLLIAEVDIDGNLIELDRRMTIVRLGEGVDATGRFSDAAIERTFAACDEYALAIRSHEATHIRFVATSATRDAENREEFVAGVKARLGCKVDVITGKEEAALSFLGATGGLKESFQGPYLVIDIGGGSTEFVVGTDVPDAARSVDIGCVRMTERHLAGDPASAESIDAAMADIDAAILKASKVVPFADAKTVIGLAGSVTTVAAMALGLQKYDRKAIHGSVISADAIHRVFDRLIHMTRAQRSELPFMHPGRVDVIGAGSLVLDRIMKILPQTSIVVSEHDILDGIAVDLAKKISK